MNREEAEKQLTELSAAAGEVPSGPLAVGACISHEEFLEDLLLLARAGSCFPSTDAHDNAMFSYVAKYLHIDISKAKDYLLELDRLALSGILNEDNIQAFIEFTDKFEIENHD